MHRALRSLFLFPGVFFILLIQFSCSEKNDCSRLKNGNFISRFRSKKGDIVFTTIRKDTIQIETDKQSGFYSKLRIKWTGDCQYEGILLESTFPFPDSIQQVRKTVPIVVDIISSTKEYYIYKAQRKNYPVLIDTMWIDK